MQIAEVVPRAKLPRKLEVFDYIIPKELEGVIGIGSVVLIPFRRRSVVGVVVRLKDQSVFSSVKSIEKVLEDIPSFRKDQLQFLRWVSEHYASSPAFVLRNMLPEVPQKKVTMEEQNSPSLSRNKEFETPSIVLRGAQYIRYNTLTSKLDIYEAIVKQAMAENRQVLFLFPTFRDLNAVEEQMKRRFSEEFTTVFSVDDAKKAFFTNWLRIAKKKVNIVFGTRSAIFAPLSAESVVIVDEEGEEDHKQREPNPRYDVRTAALMLTQLARHAVFFSGRFPRVEARYALNEGFLTSALSESWPTHPLRIINMRDQFSAGRFSVISDPLAALMEDSLSQKKQCVLFLNRRGTGRALQCIDCKRLAECEICSLPLSYHVTEEKPKLSCHHCEKDFLVPPFCAHCKGIKIKVVGKGTEKVEVEAQKLFPQAKILRVDADADFSSLTSLEKDIREADILIGTSFLWQFLPWKTVGCVGMLSLESMLGLPDVRVPEKTLGLFVKLRGLLEEHHSPFPLVVQTFTPEHPLLRHLEQGTLDEFYAKELEERKMWGYPPFKKNIALTYQGVSAFQARRVAEKVYADLSRLFARVSDIAISPPQPAQYKRKGGGFRYALMLKCDATHLAALHTFFKTLEDRWIVDVDPS